MQIADYHLCQVSAKFYNNVKVPKPKVNTTKVPNDKDDHVTHAHFLHEFHHKSSHAIGTTMLVSKTYSLPYRPQWCEIG